MRRLREIGSDMSDEGNDHVDERMARILAAFSPLRSLRRMRLTCTDLRDDHRRAREDRDQGACYTDTIDSKHRGEG